MTLIFGQRIVAGVVIPEPLVVLCLRD